MKQLLLIATLGCMAAGDCSAQDRRYDYTGSFIPKFSAYSVTDAESGLGIAAEYRLHPFLSLQAGIDFITPLVQQGATGGAGFRIRPEGRIYIPHRGPWRHQRHFDFYGGLEISLKYIHTDFEEWQLRDDLYGNTYQQYYAFGTRNFAFGPVFRLGIQWYIGPARRLVIDAAAGCGPVFNAISVQDKGYPLPDLHPRYEEALSYNKYQGVSATLNFDVRIGYRFGK